MHIYIYIYKAKIYFPVTFTHQSLGKEVSSPDNFSSTGKIALPSYSTVLYVKAGLLTHLILAQWRNSSLSLTPLKRCPELPNPLGVA